MKAVITLVILFCIQLKSVNAQQTPSQDRSPELIALCKEVEGTYNVIELNPRIKTALTSEVCEIVKKNRKKSETVYFKYNEYITLEIYSEDKIKK